TLLLDKAMIYIEKGELDLASKSVQQCEQVVAEAKLSQADQQNLLKNAVYRESQIAAKRKAFDNAYALAEELKDKIDEGNDPQEIDKYHNLLGFIHAMQGYHTTAIQHFKKAETRDPYSLYLWGQCEVMRGNLGEGLKRNQEIMKLNDSSLQYAFIRPKVQQELDQQLTEKPN
ncbi:MAG: hypothetical protein ACE5I1_00775, partial [bacterium]